MALPSSDWPKAGIIVAGVLALLVTYAVAQVCGDADGNGTITITDGVNVLRAAAGLDGTCGDDTVDCDVDGNGAVTLTDGVNVLRAAAALPATLACATPGPGATRTPTPTATPDATQTATPEPTPTAVLRVFATSATYAGNLGGLAGADALCAMHAEAAGLAGTFKAWLSTSGGSPATTFSMAADPYVLVDGTVVATSWDDLVDGALAHPINQNENGDPVFGDAWTGTDPTGNAAPARCSDWSSTSGTGQCGSVGQADADWTDFIVPQCNLPLRLYCFEQ